MLQANAASNITAAIGAILKTSLGFKSFSFRQNYNSN